MWSWAIEPCPRWVRLLHNHAASPRPCHAGDLGLRACPPEKDHCMFGRTLLFCVAKRDGSRRDKESLAMSG